MSGALFLEWNDGTPTFVPIVKNTLINNNNSLQHVRSNHDFKFVGMRRLDEDVFAANFDFRRVFPEVAWPHLSDPLRSSAEQLGNKTYPKLLNHTNNADGFRRAA